MHYHNNIQVEMAIPALILVVVFMTKIIRVFVIQNVFIMMIVVLITTKFVVKMELEVTQKISLNMKIMVILSIPQVNLEHHQII